MTSSGRETGETFSDKEAAERRKRLSGSTEAPAAWAGQKQSLLGSPHAGEINRGVGLLRGQLKVHFYKSLLLKFHILA